MIFKISGTGNAHFKHELPQQVLNNMKKSGFGKIVICGKKYKISAQAEITMRNDQYRIYNVNQSVIGSIGKNAKGTIIIEKSNRKKRTTIFNNKNSVIYNESGNMTIKNNEENVLKNSDNDTQRQKRNSNHGFSTVSNQETFFQQQSKQSNNDISDSNKQDSHNSKEQSSEDTDDLFSEYANVM